MSTTPPTCLNNTTLLCVLFHLKYKIIHRTPEKIHIKIYPHV